ncbi:hypothetical protein EUGRSUZ_I00483 [Eucalyptus grandis]|uniref:Uncharacterized protein n=2 Tax=Eucalyptus grandis TaxID=71139 RepID=A0ACC3JDX7_EUCGR|nr:hypothetical protein EUGRSUZ_I00483 [Eucalyptus grandis]
MCTKLRYIRTPPCSFVDVETASASPRTHTPMRKHRHTSICSYLKAHKDHMQTPTSLYFNKTLETYQFVSHHVQTKITSTFFSNIWWFISHK